MQGKLAVIRTQLARRFHRPQPKGAGVGRQHPQVPLIDQIRFLTGRANREGIKNRIPRLITQGALAKFVILQFRQFHFSVFSCLCVNFRNLRKTQSVQFRSP